MNRLVQLATGGRTRWLLIALWLVALAVAAPVASHLGSVEKNDESSFLPAGAESTQVGQILRGLPGGDQVLAAVVYSDRGGITAADRSAAARARAAVVAAHLAAAPPTSVIGSPDGRALLFAVGFRGSLDTNHLVTRVDRLRAIAGRAPPGTVVAVTGPAAFVTDTFRVFSHVDGTLLIAAATVVAVLLLIIYRSPWLWLVPLLCGGFAVMGAQAVVYALASSGALTVNGQSAGVLTVLVFGAGTDYALLLVARYREELTRHESRTEAMAFALRQASPAILASGATVVLGLLTLLAAQLNSDRGMGPVGAVGIVCALLSSLTLLPAVLLVTGRKVFWPFVPRFGDTHIAEHSGWRRVGSAVQRRPRWVWAGTLALLAALAVGVIDLHLGMSPQDTFRHPTSSVRGQQLLAEHFPAGAASPVVITAAAGSAARVAAAAAATPGVVAVAPRGAVHGTAVYDAVLATGDGNASAPVVTALRDRLHRIPGAHALVGGSPAIRFDANAATGHDRRFVVPLVLLVVLSVLALLLRSVLAPFLLVGTVVVSFAAALGGSSLIFSALGFHSADQSLPLIGFIFLVALGIDYNIFLMSRVHEEARHRGTRQGMLRALTVTGAVITSAGAVLAATFGVLSVLPMVPMAETGILVAFGVLLDTLVVRSVLVPAIALDLGDRLWWPGRPGARVPAEPGAVPPAAVSGEAAAASTAAR